MVPFKIFLKGISPLIGYSIRGTAIGTNHAGCTVGIGDLIIIINFVTYINTYGAIVRTISALYTTTSMSHLEHGQKLGSFKKAPQGQR